MPRPSSIRLNHSLSRRTAVISVVGDASLAARVSGTGNGLPYHVTKPLFLCSFKVLIGGFVKTYNDCIPLLKDALRCIDRIEARQEKEKKRKRTSTSHKKSKINKSQGQGPSRPSGTGGVVVDSEDEAPYRRNYECCNATITTFAKPPPTRCPLCEFLVDLRSSGCSKRA